MGESEGMSEDVDVRVSVHSRGGAGGGKESHLGHLSALAR